MERIELTFSKIIATFFLFTLAPEIYAESPYRKTIYISFINREMPKWENVIHTIETNNKLTTIDQKLELTDYYYGYIGYLISKKQFETAEKLIQKGDKLVAQVLKVSPKNATAYSYKGSFIGYKIAISKFKSIFLASESNAYIDKAYELDPHNVQAIIDKGNLMYYAPKIFGGDKEEAIKYYLKGVRQIEINNDTYQNWAYLNLLTNIAMAYEKMDQPQHAKQMYEKILRHEPNFYWVKVDLFPKFLRRNNL